MKKIKTKKTRRRRKSNNQNVDLVKVYFLNIHRAPGGPMGILEYLLISGPLGWLASFLRDKRSRWHTQSSLTGKQVVLIDMWI